MDQVDLSPASSSISSAAPRFSLLRQCLSPVLSLFAILLACLGLFEWDVPLTRFVRALNDVQIDHLHNPWLAQWSEIGDRLGRGESLVLISLVVLAVGWGLRDSVWKQAGWQSLLAHGLAALVSNLVKHLVGRPRPKFMHAGTAGLSPAGGSGWDSFPSGHATASFAVATVIVLRFPRVRPLLIAAATAIAASRILRGSHFLTDVVGGATIGYVIGTVAASPWREWRRSLDAALPVAAMALASCLVVMTTIGIPARSDSMYLMMTGTGFVAVLGGVAAVGAETFAGFVLPRWSSRRFMLSSIAFGFGMVSGGLWATVTMLCAAAAVWLRPSSGLPTTEAIPVRSLLRETVLAAVLLGALLLLTQLRGALPLS